MAAAVHAIIYIKFMIWWPSAISTTSPESPPPIRRQTFVLSVLLAPVTLFLGVVSLLTLLIIALFSFFIPGLYRGDL